MDPWQQEPNPPAWQYQSDAWDRDRTVTDRPSRLPAVLSITTIIAVVAAVIAISALYGGGVTGVAVPAPGQPTTSGQPGPTTTTAPPTTTSGASDTIEIANPDAPLTYRVPRTWTPGPGVTTELLGVRFKGVASFAPYQCGGKEYSRAFAVSAAVQSTGQDDLDPKSTAEKFAAEFGIRYFTGGSTGKASSGTATVGGREAVLVAAPIAVSGQDPECVAVSGLVTVLAVDLGATAGKRGVALLVVVADVRGGPDEPAPPAEKVLRDIITSVRVG